MKSKLLVFLVLALLSMAALALSAPSSSSLSARNAKPLDGTNPPHAVDVDGKVIPESSATQPDKPIILAKDSKDPKWGEHKPEALFDHTKHHDLTHTLDGKTPTACVECHHTEQPSAPSNQPYLKRFERKAVLTAEQLESSKEPVKSCRNCHWQEATAATVEFPPKSIKYPKETGKPPSGKLTNDNAYHTNCIGCHDVAMKRDPKLKAPQACADCHVKRM
jgi:hypothetical protein